MAKKLKFNWNALYDDLTKRLVVVVDGLINEVYRDITSKLSAKGQADSEKEEAVLHPIKKTIEASCVFYANAILDSYGVGVFADKSADSFWKVYTTMTGKEYDDLYNSLRRGDNVIVGRKPGPYVDIWGRDQYSLGSRAGQVLEKINLKNSRVGSHAIQTAEVWLIVDGPTKVERAITTEIDKFFQEGTSKYFTEVGR